MRAQRLLDGPVVRLPWLTSRLTHLRAPLFRNGYILLVNAGVTSVLGLLYWALAARRYPADVVGANSAAIAAISLLAALSRFELNATLIRFVPRAGRHTARLVLGCYAAIVLLALGIGTLFIAGARGGLIPAAFLDRAQITPLWFIPALAFWCLFNVQDSVLIGLRRVAWVPLENALFSVAKIGLLLVLAAALPPSGIFVSYTAPAALAVLPISALIFGRLLRRPRAAEAEGEPFSLSRFVCYSAGEYAGSLFGLTLVALPPLIVAAELGVRANAYFYLPWVIASAFAQFSSNMATSLTVEGALDEERLSAYARQMIVHVMRLVVLASAGVLLFGPWLLGLLGHDYAAHGGTLMRLLALNEIPNSLVSLYFSIARVQRRTRDIALVQGGISLVFLTLLFALLPVYGITGAGVAAVVSQGAAATVLLCTRLRPLLRPVQAER
ncbi:MAG TPA: hypothetical protein VKV26_10110 [Dehalococcoidia bacterium]|nr:hypothetical protein [Dehalococcoidia bacterium]